MEETYAFRELAGLEQDLIEEQGRANPSAPQYVRSFADFFEYVKKRRPNAVSSVSAENPFPGILPGAHYTHMEGYVTNGSQIILSSNTVHHEPNLNVRLQLDSSGNGMGKAEKNK